MECMGLDLHAGVSTVITSGIDLFPHSGWPAKQRRRGGGHTEARAANPRRAFLGMLPSPSPRPLQGAYGPEAGGSP